MREPNNRSNVPEGVAINCVNLRSLNLAYKHYSKVATYAVDLTSTLDIQKTGYWSNKRGVYVWFDEIESIDTTNYPKLANKNSDILIMDKAALEKARSSIYIPNRRLSRREITFITRCDNRVYDPFTWVPLSQKTLLQGRSLWDCRFWNESFETITRIQIGFHSFYKGELSDLPMLVRAQSQLKIIAAHSNNRLAKLAWSLYKQSRLIFPYHKSYPGPDKRSSSDEN